VSAVKKYFQPPTDADRCRPTWPANNSKLSIQLFHRSAFVCVSLRGSAVKKLFSTADPLKYGKVKGVPARRLGLNQRDKGNNL
jgi:hypothetical protein